MNKIMLQTIRSITMIRLVLFFVLQIKFSNVRQGIPAFLETKKASKWLVEDHLDAALNGILFMGSKFCGSCATGSTYTIDLKIEFCFHPMFWQFISISETVLLLRQLFDANFHTSYSKLNF